VPQNNNSSSKEEVKEEQENFVIPEKRMPPIQPIKDLEKKIAGYPEKKK